MPMYLTCSPFSRTTVSPSITLVTSASSAKQAVNARDTKIIKALKSELILVNDISKEFDISIQKIALNYCLQQNLIDNVLIGVDNLNQLNQNLKDLNYELPQNIINEINTIVVRNVDLLNPSLWN